jgi:hypothetical protein
MQNPVKTNKSGSSQLLKEALMRLIKSAVRYNNADGVVKAIDETKYTADVMIGKTLYGGIPLRVLLSSQASFIEIPKVDTNCVVIFRDANNARPYILEVHECDKILMKVGTAVFNTSTDGFKIENGNFGLKKSLSALIDAILAMTVTTGTGPSGTPINFADFNKVKTDLDNYLT